MKLFLKTHMIFAKWFRYQCGFKETDTFEYVNETVKSLLQRLICSGEGLLVEYENQEYWSHGDQISVEHLRMLLSLPKWEALPQRTTHRVDFDCRRPFDVLAVSALPAAQMTVFQQRGQTHYWAYFCATVEHCSHSELVVSMFNLIRDDLVTGYVRVYDIFILI